MPRKNIKAPRQKKSSTKPTITVTTEPGFRGLNLGLDSETVSQVIESLNSTGTVLGGTAADFNNSVEQIEQKITKIERGALRYEAIQGDLENMKRSIANLEELRKPIKNVEDFLKGNVEFVTTAIETKGRFNVIETELASVQKRLEFLEDKSNKAKEGRRANWAIAVAVLSVVVSVALAFYLR